MNDANDERGSTRSTAQTEGSLLSPSLRRLSGVDERRIEMRPFYNLLFIGAR